MSEDKVSDEKVSEEQQVSEDKVPYVVDPDKKVEKTTLPRLFRACPACKSTNTLGNHVSPKPASETHINSALMLSGVMPGPIYNTQIMVATDVCLECGTMYAALVDRKILPIGLSQVPGRRAS